MKRKQTADLDRGFLKFFWKYLLSIELGLIGILRVAIISSRDLPKNQTPLQQPRSLVNRTDIYSDGFTQQRRSNPQPKARGIISFEPEKPSKSSSKVQIIQDNLQKNCSPLTI